MIVKDNLRNNNWPQNILNQTTSGHPQTEYLYTRLVHTVKWENLENLFRHFENKQDENARRYYSKLFDDTKQHADFILDTKGKEGQARKEYIKAYQHKSTHDLYYMIVTENNDKVNVTAHPITEIREMIRHIRKSERASVIKDSNQAPA